LSDILEYVEKLNEVPTDGVEETSQVTGLINATRSDEVAPFEHMTKLVEQAPDHDDNQVKVPKVL
jgi:aspartyl-tRNA(Asn)/glutamyl-tRNA(Gln) amidotransferase subunit C